MKARVIRHAQRARVIVSPTPAIATFKDVAAWLLEAAAPGLALAVAVGLAARLIAQQLPVPISEVPLAVLLGIVVGNALPLPRRTAVGLKFASQRVLRLGIVLLGARLSLGDVIGIGAGTLGLVVVCMGAALATAFVLGRALRLPPRLALLIGVGTSVCGNSAIIATAPVVEADERDVGFAVATITLFGTLAVFLYPVIGHALQLSDTVCGVWSGVAVNDTSQVVAASAAYSPVARDVATVVKLVRNTFMAPLLVLIAWWWHRHSAARLEGGAPGQGLLKVVPLFVVGFLLMATLRTVGLIDRSAATSLDAIATICILIALASVGLTVELGKLRKLGTAAICVGFGTAILLAGLSLVLIMNLQTAPFGPS